jgi:hypothetical protein
MHGQSFVKSRLSISGASLWFDEPETGRFVVAEGHQPIAFVQGVK